jgi:hypothetical protein
VHQAFDQYCEELRARAAQLADETEMRARVEHLRAFNFGRSIQHLEDSQHDFWMRLCWLLLGVAMGAALVAGCLHVLGRVP